MLRTELTALRPPRASTYRAMMSSADGRRPEADWAPARLAPLPRMQSESTAVAMVGRPPVSHLSPECAALVRREPARREGITILILSQQAVVNRPPILAMASRGTHRYPEGPQGYPSDTMGASRCSFAHVLSPSILMPGKRVTSREAGAGASRRGRNRNRRRCQFRASSFVVEMEAGAHTGAEAPLTTGSDPKPEGRYNAVDHEPRSE